MKRINLLLVLLPVFGAGYGQHCPFDGSAAVVIRVSDNNGRLQDKSNYTFILAETDTTKADSCSYAGGALRLEFGTADKALIKKYDGGWESRAALYVKETAFNKKGYWVVVLNQAETYCMLKRGNDFDFKTRKFEIQVKKAGQIINKVPVPPDQIYKLCTSAGKWSRIAPVEIVLPD